MILSPEAWGLWLDPSTDPAELQGLLRPFAGDLVVRPVSALVNNPRNGGRELVEPVVTHS